MSLQIDELKKIFEYEIKRKLSERARSTADEYRNLMNGFKFYDYTYSGKVNQTEFVKGILRTGLSGFNESDIRSIFNCYDINNSGYLDYKNFCNYLYGREPLNPLPPTSQNETQNTSNITDNNNINVNEQMIKTKTPVNMNIKQKTPLNNPNININNNQNQNLPENQNNQNLNQIPPEQNQQNIDPNQTKEYFKKLIISLKEQIHTFNGLTYYTLLFELKNNSDQNKNVSLENFVNLCKNLGINLPQNDIINFFNLLDFSGTGKISIEDIINNILDPISEHRKLYVVNKFAKLDVEKQGEVKVSLLKEKYNPKGHPDVISGKVSDEEIFKQFCYTLDIYCNLRNINENINYKQFIDYYNGISSSILDDKYFEDILNGVWDNEEPISDINPNMNMNNNNIEQNMQQNIPQEQIQNNNNNINQIQENRNMMNNFNNNNAEEQNININNRRYNNEQNTKFNKQKFIDAGFCDENLGLNSIFLGESTHNMPSNFRRKHFKKYESPSVFNNFDANKNNLGNKNIKSNDFSQNNYNRNNNYNKTPVTQSQSLPNNQQNQQNINKNQNQYKANNNFNNFMNNNDSRQKRFKISYNPITNEYIQRNPNNTNSNPNNRKTPYNIINGNSNSESTTSTITNNNNNTNQNVNSEEQVKDIITNALNKFKSTLIMRGSHSLFSFQRKLSLYDLNHQGLISFENFVNIAQVYTMNISTEEIKIIFDLFDKEKTGLINYNELIQTITGQISPQRKLIIKNVFDKFNKDNNGKVSINEIKSLFNPRRHPDVISGKKREGEVFGEFLDDMENYKEYLENSRGVYDNAFSLEDFINFYNEIGVGIDDDTIFEYMINNCWNLDNNNNFGGNRYKNNTGYDFRNNNAKSGNLMARAGSQIINNNIF